jgi:hypothetical protein
MGATTLSIRTSVMLFVIILILVMLSDILSHNELKNWKCGTDDRIMWVLQSEVIRKKPGNTTGGSITVHLTSCLTALESAVWQLAIFVFICKTGQSQQVKQEVNGIVILPPLIFPEETFHSLCLKENENRTTISSGVKTFLLCFGGKPIW